MPHGLSGGFFLPAQRSVHCKGGFFSAATRAPPPNQFPLLFTLPQARGSEKLNSETVPEQQHPRRPSRRVYDPTEGDVDTGDVGEDEKAWNEVPETPPLPVQRSASTSRFVRGRKFNSDGPPTRTAGSRSTNNNATSQTNDRPRPKKSREHPAKPSGVQGDINSKFEIAMKELDEIKDEFNLKQHRQSSAPVLPSSQPTSSLTRPSRFENSDQRPNSSSKQNEQPQIANNTPRTEEYPPSRNLQSPRQRLQVAEMVMRKLYKKNLETEQVLANVKAEKDQLAKRLADLEADKSVAPAVSTSSSRQSCQRCPMNESVGFTLVNPPSMETISRIDQQQLDYLRHLAAEQDRTISSLKLRIEELSGQLTAVKRQPAVKVGKTKSTTPRQAANKLQGKLQDALLESERQKANYLKLKRDFQHLLALKTKTLYENPQQLNASARELVALMEKQLHQLEAEHSRNLSAYNSKLYESEQQSCDSYAQQKLLEEEMERVTRDVQQRDAVDEQIEQCMANVFERLHQVESENVQFKKAILHH